MRKCIDLLEQSPIITGAVGVIVGVGGMKILSAGDGDLLKMLALRVVLFLAICVFVYLISREKAFKNCHTTTGYVVRWELLIMIPYTIMLPLQFTLEEGSIVPDWPVKLILSVILSVFIGLYEETVFRVVINDAILYKFRNCKYVYCKGKQVQIPLHGIPIKAVVSIQEILQSGMDFIDPVQRVIFIGQALYLSGIIGFVLQFQGIYEHTVGFPSVMD